jgi:hypothetical protein
MGDPVVVLGAFIGLSSVVGVLVVTIVLTRVSGGRGAAALLGSLPFAAVPAVIGVAVAAKRMIQAFAGMAESPNGGMALVQRGVSEAWTMTRSGVAISGALSLLVLAAATTIALRVGSHQRSSARRTAAILAMGLLSALPLAVQSGLMRQSVRVANAMTSGTDDPAGRAATDAVLASEGFGTEVGEIAQRLSRNLIACFFGGVIGFFISAGLGAAGVALGFGRSVPTWALGIALVELIGLSLAAVITLRL